MIGRTNLRDKFYLSMLFFRSEEHQVFILLICKVKSGIKWLFMSKCCIFLSKYLQICVKYHNFAAD